MGLLENAIKEVESSSAIQAAKSAWSAAEADYQKAKAAGDKAGMEKAAAAKAAAHNTAEQIRSGAGYVSTNGSATNFAVSTGVADKLIEAAQKVANTAGAVVEEAATSGGFNDDKETVIVGSFNPAEYIPASGSGSGGSDAAYTAVGIGIIAVVAIAVLNKIMG